MLFANSDFEAEISKVFYDKEITVLKVTQTKDDEGGLNPPQIVEAENFKGNTNASSAKNIEEFGANTTARLILTTSNKNKLSLGDKLRIDGTNYEIVELAVHDTHQKAGLKKWKSK